MWRGLSAASILLLALFILLWIAFLPGVAYLGLNAVTWLTNKLDPKSKLGGKYILAGLFMGVFFLAVCLGAGILLTECAILWFVIVLGDAFGISGLSCSRMGSVCIYFSVVDGLADFFGCYFSNLMPICSGCFHTVTIKLYTCSMLSISILSCSNISTIFCFTSYNPT